MNTNRKQNIVDRFSSHRIYLDEEVRAELQNCAEDDPILSYLEDMSPYEVQLNPSQPGAGFPVWILTREIMTFPTAYIRQRIEHLVSDTTRRMELRNVSVDQYASFLRVLREMANLDELKLLLEMENRWLAVTGKSVYNFLNKFNNPSEADTIGSDSPITFTKDTIDFHSQTFSGTIRHVEKYHNREVLEGAFFEYLVDPKFFALEKYKAFFNEKEDLSEYGIYTEFDESNYEDICLYKAFENLGMSGKMLREFKLSRFNKAHYVPKTKLPKICEQMGIRIKLAYCNSNRVDSFGKEGAEYLIGLVGKHYVPRSVKRYGKSLTDWTVVKALFNEYKEYLIPLNHQQLKSIPSYFDREVDYESDDCETHGESFDVQNMNESRVDRNQRKDKRMKEERWERIQNKKELTASMLPKEYIFLDIETHTVDNRVLQYACVISWKSSFSDETRAFTGRDCVVKMLKFMATFLAKYYVVFIAHNAKFDWTFVRDHVTVLRELYLDQSFIRVDAMFEKHHFSFIDSYKLISLPLSSFEKTFNLTVKKEVLPYDLYNELSIEEMSRVPIERALAHLEKHQAKDFLNNIKEWLCVVDDKHFNALSYSVKYCKQDTIVLRDGYHEFREYVFKHLDDKLEIKDFSTISSVAHEYFVRQGVYEGCYAISGYPQEFIQRSVRGGRVVSNCNKRFLIEEPVLDYDAVSLYPSAMKELGGYLKGKPKPLREHQKNMEFLSSVDGYFVEIEITKVGRPRELPLVGVKQKDSVLYTNDIVGLKQVFDKIMLEDLITYQKIEFKIIQGFYFDEGRNAKIGSVIQHLFEKRVKLGKNPAQSVIKLIMNSSYGRTILRQRESVRKTFNSEKQFKVWLSRNYRKFNSAEQASHYDSVQRTTDKIVATYYNDLDGHFNSCHIGAEILSMSKRIMNRVICLAEDIGVKIYYQDTDSMHLLEKDLPLLKSEYKNRYNKDLDGKDLGQFHSDFPKTYPRAIKTIIIGPKMYYDLLESVDGKSHADHIRLKGVPTQSICHKVDTSPEFNSVYDLYLYLYNGGVVPFDITCDGKKFTIKYVVDGMVSLGRGQFVRSVKIKDKPTFEINSTKEP